MLPHDLKRAKLAVSVCMTAVFAAFMLFLLLCNLKSGAPVFEAYVALQAWDPRKTAYLLTLKDSSGNIHCFA